MMAKITSVIDIGSNSVRLAIFKKSSRFGFSLIYELKSKVRISENSYENDGFLQEIPMQRTISVLSEFMHIIQQYKSRKVLCVATSAVRDAPNRFDFIKRVYRECGIQIKVLNGDKEAYFGGLACANLSHRKDGIMIDIGGGSTECTLIEGGRIMQMISLDLGTIRLKELFWDKKIDKKQIRAFMAQEIEKLSPNFKHSCIFGVGGTIRALAKLYMKQEDVVLDMIHGFVMPVKKIEPLMDRIIKSKEDRLGDFGISDERSDNIQGGLLILSVLLGHFQANEIVTCGVGIREGVFLADLLRNHSGRFPPSINPSVEFIKDELGNSKSTKIIKARANEIFTLIASDFGLNQEMKELLNLAMSLWELGTSTDFYHANKHSAYRVKYMLSYGYSHQQRSLVAMLLEFSDKKLPKECDMLRYQQNEFDLFCIQILSYIFALSRVLCLGDLGRNIEIGYRSGTLYLGKIKENFLLQEKITRLSIPKSLRVILN